MEKTEKEIDEAIEAFQKKFALRLSRLRTLQKVSAREMSLAIGQSNSYINNIETGKSIKVKIENYKQTSSSWY